MMIPWLLIGAIFALQGVSRIREWPSHVLPSPIAIAVALLLVALTRYVAKQQRPGLFAVAAAILSDAAARYIHVPPLAEGMIWIVWAGVLVLYAFRMRSQLSEPPTPGWAWWKILAVIGLLAFLLLPPGSC